MLSEFSLLLKYDIPTLIAIAVYVATVIFVLQSALEEILKESKDEDDKTIN